MLNIKNQVNYLKFFNFFVSIFLLLFFSFKNSLYSYLIFIIISNIIYYIFDKKNIFNFFFITVIITSILYIYLYNKKEGFKEGNNHNQSPSDAISSTCALVSTTSKPEFKHKSSTTLALVRDKLGTAIRKEAAAGAASNTIKSAMGGIQSIGGRGAMGHMHSFAEMNDEIGEAAGNDAYISKGQERQIKNIEGRVEHVSAWADTGCTNSNEGLASAVGSYNQRGSNEVDTIRRQIV